MMRNYLAFFILCFTASALFTQSLPDPAVNFHPPMDGQLYLSGTFGELRPNHFHAGIDVKTGGVEGKNIYSIAEGYVSRIKVSTGGYGKVVYITHPSGHVSVYGHLQRFYGALAEYVKNLQYEKESFVVEAFPEPDRIPVKRGELIAYSGNTGSSAAPHLHFEIREAGSEHPLNPLLFDGISVKDFFRPRLLQLAIYPVDEASRINGRNDTAIYTIAGWGEEHYLPGDPKIEIYGRVSFGISAYDPMNDVPNKNGIYTLDLYRDEEKVFGLEMDRISFATSRYLNSLIDYNYYKKESSRLVRTQVDTNNRLLNYRDVYNNGILTFDDSTAARMKYVARDVYGNTSSLAFNITTGKAPEGMVSGSVPEPVNGSHHFHYARKNVITTENITLEFPENCFYKSLDFRLDSTSGDTTLFSPVYHVHDPFTPVHKSFRINIKPHGYPENVIDKLYISYLDRKGGRWYIGARWDEGWLSAESKLLGDYSVMADTIAPSIKPVNISDGMNAFALKTIQLKIADKGTGISRYRGEINGEWVLFEYETKKNLLEYIPDGHLKPGENTLEVTVSDLMGNETVYRARLMR